MRSLRYWLGLPLFNLIFMVSCIFLLCCLKYDERMFLCVPGIAALVVFAVVYRGGGIFVFPLLSGLFYPLNDRGRLPLYAVVLISAAAIFSVCVLTWALLIKVWSGDKDTVDLFFRFCGFSALLTLVEAAGYSLGLFIASKAAKRRRLREIKGSSSENVG